jgi:hypothetical protein
MDTEEKTRLTLWVDKKISYEIKKQAKERGVSASAYISLIVAERKIEEKK